ncbi:MAG: TlpA family protein disulfide reductase [Taibaiella sp.]|nr:TlpA family protein disulfide reductase [Taibaiella sp.]
MYRSLFVAALICILASPANAQKFLNKKAPVVSLSTAFRDGKQVVYTPPKGKFLLIEFWATWCTPCVRNIPHLNELAEWFAGKMDFISISDEMADKVSAFIAAHPIAGIVGVDKDGKTFKAFGVKSRPTTFIINDKGVVVFEGTPFSLTPDMLTALLKGEVVTGDKTREATGRLGSWGGGEDPVVTGSFDMKKMGYQRYEVVRKAVSENGGSGWKDWRGEVGVTLLGVSRKEILAFTKELPSDRRVIDNLADSDTRWDVIFYRKAGYDLARAKTNIEAMVSETFSAKVMIESKETTVWSPVYDSAKLIDATKVADDDPKMKTYETLSDICAKIEKSTGKIIECPALAEDLYVDVFELGNKYYSMSGDDLITWLRRSVGLTFSMSQGYVKFTVLSAR